MTKRRVTIACLLAALVAAFSVVPLGASADRDGQLVVGIRLDFTSSTHAEGTFAACCIVTDSGVARADVTSFTPQPNNRAIFEATETLAGSKGDIILALRGTTGPLDSAVHIARGRWKVVGGTGAYEGLSGRGTFTAVTDQTTGALTAVNKGKASGARG
ncbi:MAG: hypothetical protein ACRDNI_10890 [Gaiellaceae bacterium]